MGSDVRNAVIGFACLAAACGGGDTGPNPPPAPPPPPPAPVVTTVEVAAASAALLPTDTTFVTATVKDQFGNVMTGQTVTWSTSDGNVAQVTGAGMVTAGAVAGSANVIATVGTRTGQAAVSVSRDDRFGYVWAHDQASASYQVNNGYEHLSNGQKATITRTAAGVYAVTFPGLGATGGQRTNVQISAYNSGSNYCKTAGWATTGADLVVQVRCYTTAGVAADARYTLLAAGATALGGRLGFALAHDPAVAGPYAPQQARSSRGQGIQVTRVSAGRYLVLWKGLGRVATDGPEQVLVTAVGDGSERCWVEGWSFGGFDVSIRCADAAGALTDARFSVLLIEKSRPNAKAAFAWAHDPANAGPYAPSPGYSYNSAAQANSIVRTAVGSYSVTFDGMSRTAGLAETILVSAYGGSARACRIGSWGGTTTVSIFCYDAAGALMDSWFDVVLVQ